MIGTVFFWALLILSALTWLLTPAGTRGLDETAERDGEPAEQADDPLSRRLHAVSSSSPLNDRLAQRNEKGTLHPGHVALRQPKEDA